MPATEANTSLGTSLVGAFCASAAGASAGSAIAAARDASAAAAPFFGSWGLIAPLALVVAVAGFGLRWIFGSGHGFAPLRLLRGLEERAGDERRAWVGGPPAAALLGLLGLVAIAGVSARAFAAELGGAASFGWVGLSVLPVLFAVASAARSLAGALGPRLESAGLGPRGAVLGSAAAFALGVAALVALGETSGGGPFSILGVLRREELDLRAPAAMLVILLGALLVPTPRRAGLALAAGLAGLAPLGFTLAVAHRLEPDAALAIERQAPLGRVALAVLRKVTDRDRDGVSALFAGGDCDDHDRAVSPRAVDVPGNGKDEDCSGADAALVEKRAPSAVEVAAHDAARARLPDDLNVVLVTIDTLRADLGYLGNPRPVSPHLDALAAKGVVFERAYSLASYTGKSMGPLMIGKYSSELEGGFLHFNRYSKRETFVQERLQAAGIYTVSVQGYWYFFKDSGFERGFSLVDSRAAPKVAAIEGDQTSNSDEQADAAIELLARPELGSGRFFLWMHFVDPHAEYAPHPEHDFGPKPRDRYDGEVAFVDRQLGRFLDALNRAPFGGRTAVVVTSDHGEAFGEHGMIRHGFELWEELVRVPLIVAVPGVPPRRVTARRSGIDLVPTLLDLFKVPHVARSEKDFLSGESLLPDVLRRSGESDPERPIFIDMARGPHNAERRALIDGDQKLIVSEGRTLGLYDLANDPGEKTDLSRDKARLQAARDRLATFTSRLRPVPMPPP